VTVAAAELLAAAGTSRPDTSYLPDGPSLEPLRAGLCEEARIMHAQMFIEEARRRLLLDHLDSLCRFLVAGATVDQTAERLSDLLDALHPAGGTLEWGEVA
jgi:hypothetical protein